MKNILLLMFLSSFSVLFGQSFTQVTSGITAMENSCTAWGDYDNDGDLDLVISGSVYNGTNQTGITHLYTNDGNGSLALTDSITFPGMYEGYLEWADFNQDNQLDLLVVGFDTDSWQAIAQIYENLGGGNFNQMNGTNFIPVQSASAICNDFDNDGDMDVFISGNAYAVGLGRYACMYFNNGNGTFTSSDSFLGVNGSTSMASGDFDGDGDVDLIYAGIHLSPGGRITKYYENLGDGNFTDSTNNDFIGVHSGTISTADFDNDGDLDILISGWEESTYQNARLYENDGHGTFHENTIANFTGLMNCDISWGDYDVDGDLDVLITGSRNGNAQRYSKIYTNQNGGVFTELMNASLQELYTGSCDWIDIDNDGDLDILLTGRDDGQADQYALIYHNESLESNLQPDPPTDLIANVNGDEITLTWASATDIETPSTSLSYNYYIKRIEDDFNLCSPLSNISNGYRKIVGYGNSSLNTSWTIKGLPLGEYKWSVQSIDQNFEGSYFAENQTFKIEEFSELQVNIFPIPIQTTININVQSPFTGDMNMTIYNIMGQEVFNTSFSVVKNVEWQNEIELPVIASGSYHVELCVNQEVARIPVIILGID